MLCIVQSASLAFGAEPKDDKSLQRADINPATDNTVFDGNGPLGLGIMLGEPSGITAKLWLSEGNALQAGATWSLSHDYLAVLADYTYSFWYIVPREKNIAFPLYVGIGGALGIGGDDGGKKDNNSDTALSARVPFGAALAFRKIPLEIFLEIAPALVIIPDMDADLMGCIGARVYLP